MSGTFSTSGQSITNVVAPLRNTGLPTRPNLSIDAATTSAAGSLSAADYVALQALIASGGGGSVTRIATTTLGGAAASISFTSIPGTYKHLWLVLTGRGDTAAVAVNVKVRLQNDSSAIYDDQQLYAANAAVNANENIAATWGQLGEIAAATGTANCAGMLDAVFADYAGTTFYKTWRSVNSDHRALTTNNQYALMAAGHYRATGAITRLDVFTAAGNFATGTTATLYGMF